ncbi:hypothetical protein EDD22DRAFT_955748 [Suillus occidentalis]|nr:hypothetical protein EDD22DRAFT_955748 [Suillus occidentalis]
MSSNSGTLSNDSRSNDGIEPIVTNTTMLQNRLERHALETRWGCVRYCGFAQGVPSYSRRGFKPEASPPDTDSRLRAERDELEPLLEAPSQDGSLEDTNNSHRKRKRSEDDSTPRDFDDVITDRRATSVPATELPRKKNRKIGRNFGLPEERLLVNVVQEVVKSILLEICQSIETHGF